MANNRPKQVLLFQEDEKALGYMYQLPKGYDISNIEVKSIDYDVEEFERNYTLVGTRPTKNSIYYLHPYEKNTYIHEDIFHKEEEILKRKINYFMKVGEYLGATKMEVKVDTYKKRQRNTGSSLDASIGILKNQIFSNYSGSLEINNNKENYKEINIKITETLDAQPNFDLSKNIALLRDELKYFNLHEPDLERLIESRDGSISGNISKSRSIKTELSSEYEHLIDTSSKLNIPQFELSSKSKNNIKTFYKVVVDIHFTF